MKSVLFLLLLILVSSGFGRVLLRRCTVLSNAPLERFAYGTAIGLGIGALGVFALGLAGMLSFVPITFWWTLLGAIGLIGTLANVRDALHWLGRARPSRHFRAQDGSADLSVDLNYARLIAPVTLLALVLVVLFCVCACFQPPTGHEWDVLAYHLADAKVFLAQHRISVLPTEHHSNFPFLMEMLYCVGLLYDGYPLANLLHLTMGVLTLLAVLGFCRRVLPGQSGWIAILLLATTPIYLWECCVAYIDVGLGLYVTLAAFAGTMLIETARALPEMETAGSLPEQEAQSVGGLQDRSSSGLEEARRRAAERQRRLREWGLLAGAATGFALGIKYLALIPFAMLPLLLVYRRVPFRQIATVIGVAVLIGSPWYVKNLLLTHNPVYPYLFKLFPRSLYWSADRAAIYQSEQSGFGFPHTLTQPAVTVSNLLQTPWRMLAAPNRFTNRGDFTFMALMGGLYAAGVLPLVYLRKIPRPIGNLLLLFGSQLMAWFFVAQHIRYLVSLLPIAAVIAAYGMSAFSGLDRARRGRAGTNLRLFPTVITLILVGQVLLMFWAASALPISERVAARTGQMPTALTLGDVIKNATEPESRESYKARHLDVYEPMDWINRNSSTTDGVVLYDEPRGFYLDRPYIWGNREHSSYIPYDRMRDGYDLTKWLHERGYRYALINLNWSPGNVDQPVWNGQEMEKLRSWYVEAPMPGQWRFLLADAMRRGLWTPTLTQFRGVVVLEIVGADEGAETIGRKRP
jgi:hypothetical protein